MSSSCDHEEISVWRIADTGEPAGLWCCKHCRIKFYPANDPYIAAMRDDMKRMDYLETEPENEPGTLFRRNQPIERHAVDEAMQKQATTKPPDRRGP